MVFELIKHMRPKQKCLKAREEGEFLIVQSPCMDILYLNAVAKDFFLKSGNGKSLEEIRNEMLSEYAVSFDVLTEDLTNLIRDLQWKNLLILEEEVKFESLQAT